jgi:RimJ/RimL family protein N-acetyltransferase
VIEILHGHDEAVGQWVAWRLFEGRRAFTNFKAMGWCEDGQLIGGTVFHNFDPGSGVIEMSTASISPRWLTRRVINAMYGYIFDVAKCQATVLRVSEFNEGMVEIAQRFGYQGVLIPRLRGRHEAEWIFLLTEEQWRAHPLCLSDSPKSRIA